MYTLFITLLALSSLVIVLTVLVMEPKTEGMGTLGGGETNVFGKSASRGKEALLGKVMIGAAIVFLISSIMVAILS